MQVIKLLALCAEHPGDENLQTDADEDDATQDGCLAGELGAELLADVQARHAEEEGDHRNDDGCCQRHQPAVLRDGNAHRECVDAGGHALHEECARAQLSGFLGLFALAMAINRIMKSLHLQPRLEKPASKVSGR